MTRGSITKLDAVRRKKRIAEGTKAVERGEAVRFDPYAFDGRVVALTNAKGDTVIGLILGDGSHGLVMQVEDAMRLGVALHQAGLRANIDKIARENPALVEQVQREAEERAAEVERQRLNSLTHTSSPLLLPEEPRIILPGDVR